MLFLDLLQHLTIVTILSNLTDSTLCWFFPSFVGYIYKTSLSCWFYCKTVLRSISYLPHYPLACPIESLLLALFLKHLSHPSLLLALCFCTGAGSQLSLAWIIALATCLVCLHPAIKWEVQYVLPRPWTKLIYDLKEGRSVKLPCFLPLCLIYCLVFFFQALIGYYLPTKNFKIYLFLQTLAQTPLLSLMFCALSPFHWVSTVIDYLAFGWQPPTCIWMHHLLYLELTSLSGKTTLSLLATSQHRH